MTPINPFKTFRDVELGHIDVSEAAKELGMSVRSVGLRLGVWAGVRIKHDGKARTESGLEYVARCYDAYHATHANSSAERKAMVLEISAKIGKSYRQTIRLLTEYAGPHRTKTFVARFDAHLRLKTKSYELKLLAARVIIGLDTVPGLLKTSDTDDISKATMYRALKKLLAKHNLTAREVRKLDPISREEVGRKIQKEIEEHENGIVREQGERDRLAIKRFQSRPRQAGRRATRVGAELSS